MIHSPTHCMFYTTWRLGVGYKKTCNRMQTLRRCLTECQWQRRTCAQDRLWLLQRLALAKGTLYIRFLRSIADISPHRKLMRHNRDQRYSILVNIDGTVVNPRPLLQRQALALAKGTLYIRFLRSIADISPHCKLLRHNRDQRHSILVNIDGTVVNPRPLIAKDRTSRPRARNLHQVRHLGRRSISAPCICNMWRRKVLCSQTQKQDNLSSLVAPALATLAPAPHKCNHLWYWYKEGHNL